MFAPEVVSSHHHSSGGKVDETESLRRRIKELETALSLSQVEPGVEKFVFLRMCSRFYLQCIGKHSIVSEERDASSDYILYNVILDASSESQGTVST